MRLDRLARLRILGAIAVASLTTMVACAGAPPRGDVPPRAPLPASPGWLPDAGVAPGPVATADDGGAPESALFAAMVPASPLAGPQLAPARDLLVKGKRIDAARLVDARAAQVELEATRAAGDMAALKLELTRLHLLSATLRRDGGDPDEAVESYRRVVETGPVLAAAARVEIAAIRLRQGRAADALAELDAVEPAERTNDEWLPLHAEAAARAGDADLGAREIEAFLARPRKPATAATIALRVASALLARPGIERAEAAARLARKIVGLASGSVAAEAHALEKRALDTLPRDRRARLAGSLLAEKIEGARAKLRARDARAAVTLLDRLVKAEGKKASGEEACALHRVRGDALGEVKRKAEAADAYGLAIEACSGGPDRIEILFAAAKASARAERAAEAESRYARVEAEAPKSRLADDARAARVQAALDRGDLGTASALADSAVATYPSGDVVFDAPFALALDHMVQGRWDRAHAVLEASAKDAGRERSYLRAGRFHYYLGRSREALRDPAGARAAYADVLAKRPGSYYGALAHARLEEMERGAGALAFSAARKRALASSPLPEPTAEELSSNALRRAIELSLAGDPASVESEIAGHAEGSRASSPGLRWWLARLVAPSDPIRASSLLRGISEVESPPGDVDFDVWLELGPFGRSLAVWQIAYPRPFATELAAASAESGVTVPLLLSIMREESAFSPTALSRAGARGLLQLMPATARTMARPLSLPHDADALQRPEINTRLGARFLGKLRQRFGHQPLLAIPSYNAGPLAVDRWCEERPTLDLDLWVETIPYRETRLYTKRVLGSLAAYDLLDGAPRGEVFFTPRRACLVPAASEPADPRGPESEAPEPRASWR